MGISQNFTSVAHPQANGQTEVMNRAILRGLKARLDRAKGLWADELPSVLWAHRTTEKTATGETSFNLTYGTEAVIPAEIEVPTLRLEAYDERTNEGELRTNLDLLDEVRDLAHIRTAAYQQKVARYYNARVKKRNFRVGDLVLRKVMVPEPGVGKLEPNWEGPYRVKKALSGGAYELGTLEGKQVPRAWNVVNLRRYYL